MTGIRPIPLGLLDPRDSSDEQGLVFDGGRWGPGDVVRSLVEGDNVTIDNTDPAHPIVSATAGGGGGGGSSVLLLPGLLSGGYYSNPYAAGSSNTNLAAGVMEFHPLPVPNAVTVDQLAAQVGVANASGRLRLGLYDSDGNGKPDNLVVDAGQVSSAATGLRSAAVSQALTPGLYWLASLGDVVGGTWQTWAATPGAAVLGYNATPAAYTRLVASGVTTGAMPSTAPTLTPLASGTGGLRLFAHVA